ncbi:MAG TPA: hypothetical protein VGK36_02515 [Candidatus Angelobacter sp.]|jgi:hypothetical protein
MGSILLLALSTAAQQAQPASEQFQSTFKVHGHWIIDVRKADGTLVSHTEFENALAQPGTTLLTEFLGRTSIPGDWVIYLTDGGQAGACGSGLTNPQEKCVISETNDQGVMSNNLTVTTATPGNSNGSAQLILKGSVAAMFNSSVVVVETGLAHCKRTATAIPTTCAQYGSTPTFLGYETFSHAALSTPVPVSAGQIIQITITFTFS